MWARGRVEEWRERPLAALEAFRQAVAIAREQGDRDGHLSFYEESVARMEVETSP